MAEEPDITLTDGDDESRAHGPRLVLDTSLFVNPDAQRYFGHNMVEAVNNFVSIARHHGVGLWMPVSIYRELSHFAEPEALALFRREAVVRGPDIHNLQIPAAIVHSFIRDLRYRVDRGLRVAEKAARGKGDADEVRRLRARYREALRTGMVDSTEDFEVILLAREVGGAILSEDQGIANFAEQMGVEILGAKDFVNRYPAKEAGTADE